MKLLLEFEGYFQMRMATDPDPTDEKRGVSGYTFALAGEPDLDAKVHFQPDEPGVWQREFGPKGTPGPRVGVTVRRASIDGKAEPDLEGAKVQFIDAQILEHNGVLVRNDFFFIDPLHVRVYKDASEVLLERLDWVNPAQPSMPLWEATSAMLVRRQPRKFVSNSPEVAAATGLKDASNATLIADRDERRANLEKLLEETSDDTQRAALVTRIEQLKIVTQWWNLTQGTWKSRPIDRRAAQLALLCEGWDIDMNGEVRANAVGGDPTRTWPLRFWMGGWDGDALTSYVRGTWEIPLA